ncbi:MAG: cell division protein ZapA [Deltaproteobacteria bacterium]|nr:cell division protein ZapA [Deltaproteobacteria bacterium]
MSATGPNARPTVQVEIAGQRLRLTAHADPGHLERLAALVNERVQQLQGASGARPQASATLLALVALDLADELHAARCLAEEARAEARAAVAAAEARARDVEDTCRRAVAEVLADIDRALEADLARHQQDSADDPPDG